MSIIGRKKRKRCRYSVGKYISIEKQIEKTKDRYYDTLEESDAGWQEEENDPTLFTRYMLQAILACYSEFEERVGLMAESGNGSTAYDKSFFLSHFFALTPPDAVYWETE